MRWWDVSGILGMSVIDFSFGVLAWWLKSNKAILRRKTSRPTKADATKLRRSKLISDCSTGYRRCLVHETIASCKAQVTSPPQDYPNGSRTDKYRRTRFEKFAGGINLSLGWRLWGKAQGVPGWGRASWERIMPQSGWHCLQ